MGMGNMRLVHLRLMRLAHG